MIKLELTRIEAELLMSALKIAEEQKCITALHAADDMDYNEEQDMAVAFYALRNIISCEVEKGE